MNPYAKSSDELRQRSRHSVRWEAGHGWVFRQQHTEGIYHDQLLALSRTDASQGQVIS
jgi:hypothetical protein